MRRTWRARWPSEAGLHLSARIRHPAQAAAILDRVRQCMPGAQSVADYAMTPPAHPALTFGYGVIDADAIPAAVARLRAALARM